MTQSNRFQHQSILDSLTPRERHTYFELIRLAAPEDTIDEEYQIPISKGSFIISFRQLEKYLDITRSTIRRALDRLVEKDLIELSTLGRLKNKNGYQFRTLCKIKHYQMEIAHQTKSSNIPTAVESLYQLESQHLMHRLAELENFFKKNQRHMNQSDHYLFKILLHTYQTAKNMIHTKQQYLATDEGLFIENEDQDLKVLIQGESRLEHKTDLQLRAILTLIESLNIKSIVEEEHSITELDIANAICQSAKRLLEAPISKSSTY